MMHQSIKKTLIKRCNSGSDWAMSQDKRKDRWEHRNLSLKVVSGLPRQQISSICESCQLSLK